MVKLHRRTSAGIAEKESGELFYIAFTTIYNFNLFGGLIGWVLFFKITALDIDSLLLLTWESSPRNTFAACFWNNKKNMAPQSSLLPSP